MKLVNRCVICDSANLSTNKAVVTPFIAERCFDSIAFSTELLKCNNCELSFYKLRFDDIELHRLYRGYQSDEYFEQRNKFEPWYTARLNYEFYNEPKLLSRRQASLIQSINLFDSSLINRARSILDFGGDDGKLIYGIFKDSDKYVFDISNSPLKPGIKIAPNPCRIIFDLVVCSNVFEHIPFPNKVMNQIKSFCSEGTVLYLDVPYERPYSFNTLGKRIIQQALLFFLRPKQFFAIFGFGMFFHLHEHINYFSEKSIKKLLIKHGFIDISVFIDNKNGYPSVCAFARKKK